MKLKEIYKENSGRKYRNVINTKGKNIEIKSIPLDMIKKHKYVITIVSLLIILVLLLAFRNNINTFFIALAFLLFMVITTFYFNNYSIECKKDVLSLKWNFQKFDLPYTHLKSIFLSRDINGMQFLPMMSYNIVIRYIDNLNFIKELTFPASLLDPEELKDFLDNFIIEDEKAEDCVKFERFKKLKEICKILGFVIFTILIGIIIYASFTNK